MATATLTNGDFRAISRQPPQDPDIQATLSDFLTYTEHFPSHLTRALTLIGDQRIIAERNIRTLHDGTTQYATLPSISSNERPDPIRLRADISHALEEAERACRMAVEESARLDDLCRRESVRLDTVTRKLKAQPMPPSRDPTPEQQALTSPNLRREGRLGTVRVEDPASKVEKMPRSRHHKAESKMRGRKIMVPGEVLPPPDPNAPVETMSPWSTPRAGTPVEEDTESAIKATPRPRSRTPKLFKSEKKRRDRVRVGEDGERVQKPRVPRTPGQPGTNAHSAVAGISTSNALLALTKPPEDAPKGSKWLPWLKLTEWEMAKLRKRMKKNAIWVPSQTMVRRELKNLGRGIAGRDAARRAAEEAGPAFLDENIESDPTKFEVTSEENKEVNAILGAEYGVGDDDVKEGAEDDAELINRGMRLNEAKKLKRQRMLEEQALQAQIAREQGLDLSTPADNKAIAEGGQKKRKRDATPKAADEQGDKSAAPVSKRLKIAPPAPPPSGSQKVPLAPAGTSSSLKSAARKAATPPPSSISKKPTITLKTGAAKAVSEEPPNRRASLRRGSNASLPGGGTASLTSPMRSTATGTTAQKGTAGARRSRRPAPGLVTAGDDESAKVGVSKRKAAPRKKGAASSGGSSTAPSSATTQGAYNPLALQQADEDIDPDEPRYCVCGDVSWGTMIACDNESECEKEWFHLTCVGLTDLPQRRTKWYCPDCRKKTGLGLKTNGLVGRNVG